MPRTIRNRHTNDAGVALIVTILLLLMISALGVAALQHAGDEATDGVSSRRKLSMVYAADSGLALVLDKLTGTTQFPDTSPVNEPALLIDAAGFPLGARTGNTQTSVPQAVMRVGRTTSPGSQLNVNSSNTLSFGVYRTGVVATDSGRGSVQLQAQYLIPEGAVSYK